MATFIKIDRKILNWEWYTDINMFHLFLYFLLKANWKDGKFKGNTIKRGQLVIGRLKVSKDTGLTEMQIRTCIKKLKSTNEITSKVTNQFTIITICKYDVYQNQKEINNQQSNQQGNQQVTSEYPTDNQQVTTIEEELIIKKNFKEFKNNSEQVGLNFDFEKLLNPPSFPNWREEASSFLSDEYFIQQQIKDKKIKYAEVVAYMKQFIYDCNLDGKFKKVDGLKVYYKNWYKKYHENRNNQISQSKAFIEVPTDLDYSKMEVW